MFRLLNNVSCAHRMPYYIAVLLGKDITYKCMCIPLSLGNIMEGSLHSQYVSWFQLVAENILMSLT